MSARYDVVLYGATGFTGRQTAAWFAAHAGPEIRWAIAGRRREALDALSASLGGAPSGVVVADSQDAPALDALCRQARVVLSTAGPYALHGDLLMDAAVRNGTDTVDITGETPWVARLIARLHAPAAARGVRIVNFCGFDSVPSDLGTRMMVQHLRSRGSQTRSVKAAFLAKGGFNGTTLESMLYLLEHDAPEILHDPLLLNPPEARDPALAEASRDLTDSHFDEDFQRQVAPFFMAPVNTRVVRRSAALCAGWGEPYGAGFVYNEAMSLGSTLPRLAGWAVAQALPLTEALGRRSWGRALIRAAGPGAGQGPSEAIMDSGFFRVQLVAEAEDGQKFFGRVSAQGDPGNRATVQMACEAALALAGPRDALPGGPERGGVLTPATALGEVLLERLRAGGMTFEVD